jgi:ATP-dependent DNA helicase Rep
VLIIGLEEDILPHRNSLEEDSLVEERRLLYVGITRAQRALMLLYAARRQRFGETVECSPSRFLEELPPDELAWEGLAEPTEEQAHASRESALASLYAMLGDDDST